MRGILILFALLLSTVHGERFNGIYTLYESSLCYITDFDNIDGNIYDGNIHGYYGPISRQMCEDECTRVNCAAYGYNNKTYWYPNYCYIFNSCATPYGGHGLSKGHWMTTWSGDSLVDLDLYVKEKCPAGQDSTASNGISCARCPSDKYRPHGSEQACVPCTSNTTSSLYAGSACTKPLTVEQLMEDLGSDLPNILNMNYEPCVEAMIHCDISETILLSQKSCSLT